MDAWFQQHGHAVILAIGLTMLALTKKTVRYHMRIFEARFGHLIFLDSPFWRFYERFFLVAWIGLGMWTTGLGVAALLGLDLAFLEALTARG